ncbi:VOC family protein [Paenibacillus albicereus]|uniref:Bleomycin resistance protein n=1 Tax=Paenibacillus albicereus TaxID=2726185 RepID=A0A6H2GTT6_9BACL|nr:glyoxalase superfamily protein [Paenibacillus albicereus]QJC50843.1 VOC family protein [Paenibacillus albicereus]
MECSRIVPVLRMFDLDKTREFYLDFLGGELLGEPPFEPSMPLYLFVSLGGCELHLSEHFGDGMPGANLRIETAGVQAFQQALLAKAYRHARPGLEKPPWGGLEMTVQDPAGNRLTFYER